MANILPYNRYQAVTGTASQIGTPGYVSAYKDPTNEVGYTDEEHQRSAAELNGGIKPGATPATDLATAEANYYANLNKDMPDEAKIREETRQRMQNQIDAIEQEYVSIFRQEEADAQARLGEDRALKSRGGLIGSDFGNAQTERVRAGNTAIMRATESQKRIKIAEVYGKIDQAVKDEVKAKKEEALGNQKAYIDYLSRTQSNAREGVKTLAQGSVKLEELSTDQYQKLLKQSGMDDFTFRAFYNASKPDETKTKYNYEIKGGKLIAYGVNPETGKLDFLEQDLPAGMSSVEAGKYTERFGPDGTLLLIPEKIDPTKPLDQQIIKGGNFAKPKSTTADGWDDASTQQRAEAQAWLQSQDDFSASDLEKLKSDPEFFLYALGQASLAY